MVRPNWHKKNIYILRVISVYLCVCVCQLRLFARLCSGGLHSLVLLSGYSSE